MKVEFPEKKRHTILIGNGTPCTIQGLVLYMVVSFAIGDPDVGKLAGFITLDNDTGTVMDRVNCMLEDEWTAGEEGSRALVDQGSQGGV